jgi:hypothetical protein
MSEQDTKREAHGQKCLDGARKARFESTGEPEEAPGLDEAVEAREDCNATSKK